MSSTPPASPARAPRLRPGLRPALALAVLCAAIFWRALVGDVFFQRDIQGWWYPRIESVVRAVASGAWPLWDPYLGGFGMPCLADPSYQLLYPLTWLNLVLPPAVYFTLYTLLHCLLAGLGLERLARRLGLAPASALVAALAWVASGPLLSAPNVIHHFASLAWAPWVLAMLLDLIARPGRGSALALAAVVTAQFLAG